MKKHSTTACLLMAMTCAACDGVVDETPSDQSATENIQTRFRFNEPHWPVFDGLGICSTVFGADSSWSIDTVPPGCGPYPWGEGCFSALINHIDDYLGVNLNNVGGLGCVYNIETYNWEEVIDANGREDLNFWPNPSHRSWTCRNDVYGCAVPGNYNVDCWSHQNVAYFYRPRTYPLYFVHHEMISYILDQTCREVFRGCNYRMDASGNVTFLGCSQPYGPFTADISECPANLWTSCS